MRPQVQHDPILRESRRAALVRRLISHEVRTEMIRRLTDLTRNRLPTVRRRLMVADEPRLRRPVRSALEVFRGSGLGRMEGAAQEVRREFPRLGPRKLKDETPRHARSRRGIAWKFM